MVKFCGILGRALKVSTATDLPKLQPTMSLKAPRGASEAVPQAPASTAAAPFPHPTHDLDPSELLLIGLEHLHAILLQAAPAVAQRMVQGAQLLHVLLVQPHVAAVLRLERCGHGLPAAPVEPVHVEELPPDAVGHQGAQPRLEAMDASLLPGGRAVQVPSLLREPELHLEELQLRGFRFKSPLGEALPGTGHLGISGL